MGHGFAIDPFEDIVAVGRINAEAVRLWMRTRTPGRHVVRWWPQHAPDEAREREVEVSRDPQYDQTVTFTLGREEAGLEPLTLYRVQVTCSSDGRPVGEAEFETAPRRPEDTQGRFAFALMSCNQPFDGDGRVREEARQMLSAVGKALEEQDVKFVLMMGDQLYADMPNSLSLFNTDYFRTIAPPGRESILECSTAEVRRLYQERYRHVWNVPGLQDIFSRYPCYMILDDHDIIDNWGSDPAHQTEKWRSLGEGARHAYFDYQAARNLDRHAELPESFHYTVDYGHVAGFVMDLRSERRADDQARLFSKDQEQDLRAFLSDYSDRKVLFFVLSVPPIHLPRFLARTAAHLSPAGEDFSDRWSTLAHKYDRDRFLRILHEHQQGHPEQRLLLLGGDIHVGCIQKVTWKDNGIHFHQFISSGLTNKASRALQWGSKLLIRMKTGLATTDGDLKGSVRLLRGTWRRRSNPFGKLNIGIVEVDTDAPGPSAKLRFKLYGHRQGEPVCVFESTLA